MTERINKNQRNKRQSEKKRNVASVLSLCCILFIFFSVILMYQRNVINELDFDIRNLEDKYEQSTLINDDLQGKLMQAARVEEIEKYALKMGMVKRDTRKAEYVSYESSEVQSADASETNGLLDWVGEIFN